MLSVIVFYLMLCKFGSVIVCNSFSISPCIIKEYGCPLNAQDSLQNAFLLNRSYQIANPFQKT